MERAPLRPVPSRPRGPVDPEQALRHVSAELPALDEQAARALALVALAGRPRDDIAVERGLSADELGELLRRARKELRRSLVLLPGSGWCERAERLISDRIDGALEPPGPARLEVHLRNCTRCVEHERRLAQATDGLVASFAERHVEPETSGAAAGEAAPPALEVVEHPPGPSAVPWRPVILEPRPPRPTPTAAAAESVAELVEEALVAAKPPAVAPAGDEAAAVEPPDVPAAAEETAAPEPAPTWQPAARGRALRPSSLFWGALLALAVLLAVLSVVLTVLGATGASLPW